MSAERNGLNEIYKIIIVLLGFGYVLYFFRDLIIPYIIALFLMYLLRPLARVMKASFERCFRSIVCCHRCVDHPVEDEKDLEEESKVEEDAEEGHLSEPLTERGKKNKALEFLNTRKNKKICDCAHILTFTLLMVLMILVLITIGIVVANTIQYLQAGKPSKLTQYSNGLKAWENAFVTWAEKAFKLKRNVALEKIHNWDFITPLVKEMVAFTSTFVSSMLLMLIILAFMLATLSFDGYNKSSLFGKSQNSVVQYIIVKTLVSLGAAFLVYLIMAVLQVPLAGMWGLLTFLLNYIPNFGFVVAVLIPMPFILLDPSMKSHQMVLSFVLPSTVHFIIGNLIEPWFFYKNKDIQLHPLTSLLCVIVWVMIWGVPGGILAVPLTTMIRAYLNMYRNLYPTLGIMADFIDAFETRSSNIFKKHVADSKKDDDNNDDVTKKSRAKIV
jgi:predicted PurR-regulated permease PerM